MIIQQFTNAIHRGLTYIRDKARGVPEGKIKVRRGWVWEGVSPSFTLGKKSKYELNGGFSCIF